jgi:hypothetical protein
MPFGNFAPQASKHSACTQHYRILRLHCGEEYMYRKFNFMNKVLVTNLERVMARLTATLQRLGNDR